MLLLSDPDFASIAPNLDSARKVAQIQGLKASDRSFVARFLQDEDSDEGVESLGERFVEEKVAEEVSGREEKDDKEEDMNGKMSYCNLLRSSISLIFISVQQILQAKFREIRRRKVPSNGEEKRNSR
jgi:hypothetical protein